MRFVIALSMLLAVGLANAKVVSVADGDVAGLIIAVNSPDDTPAGQLSPGLKVVLARRGHYAFLPNSPALAPMQTVTIAGRGATLTVNGVRRTSLVNSTRSIRFFNIRVEHIHSEADVLLRGGLVGVTFDDIDLSLGEGEAQVSLFSGAGKFVTVSDIRLSGRRKATKAVFAGSISLKHATVTGVTGDVGSRVFVTPPDSVEHSVTSSVLAGNAVPLCSARLLSGGDNIFDDDSCGLDSAGNRLVSDAGLLPLTTTLGRLPVHPLRLSSPALDSAGFCDQVFQFVVTQPFDGNGDGIVACDAGAFEMPRYSVAQGDANGLFFQQDDDGHYVSVQHTGANRYLVNWYTFDRDGNQAMVFAVGTRVGNLISGDAFLSVGGRLEPGAGPVGQAVQAWGRIKIKLRGCNAAVFQYHSDLSRFGSGLFVVDRLAFADDVNCGVSP